VKQREVPPIVEGEEIVLAPRGRGVLDECDAGTRLVAHLEHVHRGVHGPDVRGIQLDRSSGHPFGIVIRAAFLETERMHPEDDAAKRIRSAPGAQHLRRPVAQHAGMAEQEIHEVGDLQREEVARMLRADVAIELGGSREVAAQPCARRVQMHAFARERVADVALGRRQRVSDAGLAAPLAGRRKQARLEAMAHDEGRVDRERLVDGGDRIHAVEGELRDRLVVQIERDAIADGNGIA
jgi:hypothetical protein